MKNVKLEMENKRNLLEVVERISFMKLVSKSGYSFQSRKLLDRLGEIRLLLNPGFPKVNSQNMEDLEKYVNWKSTAMEESGSNECIFHSRLVLQKLVAIWKLVNSGVPQGVDQNMVKFLYTVISTERKDKLGNITKKGHDIHMCYRFQTIKDYTQMVKINITEMSMGKPKNWYLTISESIIQYNAEYLANHHLTMMLDKCYYSFIYQALEEKHDNQNWKEMVDVAKYGLGMYGLPDTLYFQLPTDSKKCIRKVINAELYQKTQHSPESYKHPSMEVIVNDPENRKKLEFTNTDTEDTFFADITTADFFKEIMERLTKTEKRVLTNIVKFDLDETLCNKMGITKFELVEIKNSIQILGDSILRENGIDLLVSQKMGIKPSTVKRCKNDIKCKIRKMQLENGETVTIRRNTCKKHNR